MEDGEGAAEVVGAAAVGAGPTGVVIAGAGADGEAAAVVAGGLAAVGDGEGEGVEDEQANADKIANAHKMDHKRTNLPEVTFFI